MKRMFIIIMLMTISLSSIFAEEQKAKKPFTFQDAMNFKSLRQVKISNDANWIAYITKPDRGDVTGYIQATSSDFKYEVARGSHPVLTDNSSWVAFKVNPPEFETANAKKDKPKNGLALVNLKTGSIDNIEHVKSFELANNGKWAAYLKYSESKQKDENNKKPIGDPLFLRHLDTKTEIRIDDVTEYFIDSTSTYFIYAVSDPNKGRDGLFIRNLNEEYCPEIVIANDSNTTYTNITWNKVSLKVAYINSVLNKKGKPETSSLNIWSYDTKLKTKAIEDSSVSGWYLPTKNDMKWTKDGQRLFFGLKPDSEKIEDDEEKKFNDTTFFDVDSILDETELLVWHWNDPRISTHQVNWWDKNKDRTYMTLYNVNTNTVSLLADTSLPTVQFTNNANYVLGFNDRPYLKEITYKGWYRDVYVINLLTGQKKLVEEYVSDEAHLSPNGLYVVYFKDKNWWSYSTVTRIKKNLTQQFSFPFYDEDHDEPIEAPSYGFAGWFEQDEWAILYDKYDVWLVNVVTGNAGAINFTIADGRSTNKTFRIVNFDKDKEFFVPRDTVLLTGFDRNDKSQGLYLNDFSTWGTMHKLETGEFLRPLGKAKYEDMIIFSKEKFETFPDIWFSDLTLQHSQKLTEINPQMKEFKWGTTELVKWVSQEGDSLEGFVMKPDSFKEGKKYPVLIYFYDKFSQRRHRFSQPAINHRPCYPVYLSDDYLIFLPDIKYRDGSPGNSALDALVSGAKKLVAMGIADSNRIGIQGHSWGGYETAYIVTQTDYFKAACAGAPVSNMTSAYSGIRLESGLARQFQYEKWQSRIGGNLWDSLDAYMTNSPIFHAENMNTPLLIMFGDQDEAVPWQQGIELFLAMRRLEKNCIMLQYKNEPHHPRKYQNKLDYAIKMKEFFDHYLLDKPAPEWIIKGKPYWGK